MTDGRIRSLDALLSAYPGPVAAASTVKEIDHVDANYAVLIAASPFVVMATSGPDGLDCSPRGDAPGFVRVVDPKTLHVPDRRGNNRLDSFRNLLDDDRIALLFLVPGHGETLRVNGRAALLTDPDLRARYAVDGKLPACIVAVTVERVYFQCSRAIVRSGLWEPADQAGTGTLPSAGSILRDIGARRDEPFDGAAYDAALPGRVKATLY